MARTLCLGAARWVGEPPTGQTAAYGFPTPDRALRRSTFSAFTILFSRRRPLLGKARAAAPGWVFPSPTASSRSTRGRFAWRVILEAGRQLLWLFPSAGKQAIAEAAVISRSPRAR